MQPTQDKVSNVSGVESGVILGLSAAAPPGGKTSGEGGEQHRAKVTRGRL